MTRNEPISYPGIDVLEVMTEAKKYNDYLSLLITRHLQPRFNVLDFGAGAGTFALPLLKRDINLYCVEPDTGLAASLQRHGANATIDLDDISEQSMDLIYTLNVLEHIADDTGTVHALSTKLKPGGILFVYVPAFKILYSSFDARIGHLRRYRRHTLAKLMVAAGLRVVECRYIDSAGFFAALLFRALQSGDINRTMVKIYDSLLFPVSLAADRLFSSYFGKNVMVVAKKG